MLQSSLLSHVVCTTLSNSGVMMCLRHNFIKSLLPTIDSIATCFCVFISNRCAVFCADNAACGLSVNRLPVFISARCEAICGEAICDACLLNMRLNIPPFDFFVLYFLILRVPILY